MYVDLPILNHQRKRSYLRRGTYVAEASGHCFAAAMPNRIRQHLIAHYSAEQLGCSASVELPKLLGPSFSRLAGNFTGCFWIELDQSMENIAPVRRYKVRGQRHSIPTSVVQ